MTLDQLNRLARHEAMAAFHRCCGSSAWATLMTERRPFRDIDALLAWADDAWNGLRPDDWLKAFAHHPSIGGDDAERPRFRSTRAWSVCEQAGMAGAADDVRCRLAEANDAYFQRFGFVFLICATGRSADEMLESLQRRLGNDRETELHVAAEQQRLILRLRLERLLRPMKTITTHVLDLTNGRPARGIDVTLSREDESGKLRSLGSARTDADGRIAAFGIERLAVGTYQLRFQTGAYFREQGISSFHPCVEITFRVDDAAEHHHVPLLLSPFGYSTYRGS
jgi:hydroxyisourate hydrolase